MGYTTTAYSGIRAASLMLKVIDVDVSQCVGYSITPLSLETPTFIYEYVLLFLIACSPGSGVGKLNETVTCLVCCELSIFDVVIV